MTTIEKSSRLFFATRALVPKSNPPHIYIYVYVYIYMYMYKVSSGSRAIS